MVPVPLITRSDESINDNPPQDLSSLNANIDALLDLALVLYRAVQCVQRTVDAFQRPLFQKGTAKLDFIDLLTVVPVRPPC